MDFDTVVMEIIVNAGNGRSFAIEALRAARAGNFDEAEQKLKECDEALIAAHEAQTEMIQSELQGNTVPMTLLMVHAQDHIMNAMTVKDLTAELIQILKERS